MNSVVKLLRMVTYRRVSVTWCVLHRQRLRDRLGGVVKFAKQRLREFMSSVEVRRHGM